MKSVGSVIPINIYPHLEQLLGYGGSRRFVAFYAYESTTVYLDGVIHGTCPASAWQAFYEHPIIAPLLRKIPFAATAGEYCLLLDRQQRQLFAFHKDTAEALLQSEKNREVPNDLRMLTKLEKLEGLFSLTGNPDIGKKKPAVGSSEHFTWWMLTTGRDTSHRVK